MEKLNPFTDFESASRGVLAFLHKRLGFGLWMVTRTEGNDWIVLYSEDHGYGVKDGAVFRWADSFCSQMVQGLGPCIAPKSSEIPAYANAPIGRQVPIGSYIGVPISDADGSLFGTLCAIDPLSMPDSLVDELPLIELLGRMLSSLLSNELKAVALQRRVERNNSMSSVDLVTGLLNCQGWEKVSDAEERRCRIYGHPACIISIRIADIQQLNEAQIVDAGVEASTVLKRCLGPNDSLARVAPNMFLVMGAERNQGMADELLKTIVDAFANAHIQVRTFSAMRESAIGMRGATEKAMKGI